MCSFCEGKETISKSPDLFSEKTTKVSLRIDEERNLYKMRMEVGSVGYTLPIYAKFCMFCGEKLG